MIFKTTDTSDIIERSRSAKLSQKLDQHLRSRYIQLSTMIIACFTVLLAFCIVTLLPTWVPAAAVSFARTTHTVDTA